MSKHTRGPWHVSVRGSVRDANEWLIAEIAGRHSGNARLIAAAPDMFESGEALIEAIEALNCDRIIPASVMTDFKDAIAKARGDD